MSNDELEKHLTAHLNGAVANLRVVKGLLIGDVAAAAIHDVARKVRDDAALNLNYLRCISGVDPGGDQLRVVYHFISMEALHELCLHVNVPRETARVVSLASLWGTANWQEREIYDLFGVDFEGHPDQRRILLPIEWEGHPLRKDYTYHAEGRGTYTETQVEVGLLPGPEDEGRERKKKGERAATAQTETATTTSPTATVAPAAEETKAEPTVRDPSRPRKAPRKLGDPPRT